MNIRRTISLIATGQMQATEIEATIVELEKLQKPLSDFEAFLMLFGAMAVITVLFKILSWAL